MEKQSFVFYKEWRDAIQDLPDDVRLEFYEAVIGYALTGELRGLKPMAGIAFNFVRPRIDRDKEEYQSIIERNRGNGMLGGRPRKNPEKPKKPSGLSGLSEKPRETQKTLIMIMIMNMIMIMKRNKRGILTYPQKVPIHLGH